MCPPIPSFAFRIISDRKGTLMLKNRAISETENPNSSRAMNATVFHQCPGVDLIVGLEIIPVHRVQLHTALLVIANIGEP